MRTKLKNIIFVNQDKMIKLKTNKSFTKKLRTKIKYQNNRDKG